MLSILRIQFKLLNAYTIHLKINNPKPISGWHWRHCPLTKAVFLWSEKSPDNTVDPANLLSDRFNKSRSRVCSSIYCRYVITHIVSGRWLRPCRRRSMAMVNRVFRRGFPLRMSYDSWLQTTALSKEKALQCNCAHVCCFHSDCHPKMHVGKPGSQEGSLKWEVMLAEKEVFPFFMAMKWMLLLPYLLWAPRAITGKKQKKLTYSRLRHPNCETSKLVLFPWAVSCWLCSRWLTNNIFGSTEVRKTVSGERNRIHKERVGLEFRGLDCVTEEMAARAVTGEIKWVQLEGAWRGLRRTWACFHRWWAAVLFWASWRKLFWQRWWVWLEMGVVGLVVG